MLRKITGCLLTLRLFMHFSIDHQQVHLRFGSAAGEHLPQETGGQEVAQHGQSELHSEKRQTLAGRQEHAGYCQKGIEPN